MVNAEVCLHQHPICCSEPQWDMLPRVSGIAVPAIAIPVYGGVQTTTPEPMSSETRHFIKHVLVPILVARYIAEYRGEVA